VVFEQPPSDPDERVAYERDVLAHTRAQLEQVLASEREPLELRRITLEGSYPDTEIVVSVWDRCFEKGRTRGYNVWRGYRGGKGLEGLGVYEQPESAATLILAWVLEG
jgi:hypothetical protein